MSREKSSRAERRRQREVELMSDIAGAMRQCGWIVPGDERAVRAAEAELLDSPIALPQSLQDPRAVFGAAPREAAMAVYRFGADADTESTLARAARDGGAITPEIEQRMRADRLAAERESDDETPEATDTP